MSFTQNKIYNLLNVQEHTGLKFKLFGKKKNKKLRVTNEINKKLTAFLLTSRVGKSFTVQNKISAFLYLKEIP